MAVVRVLPSQKWHNKLRQLHFKSKLRNVVKALLGTEAQRVHHHPPEPHGALRQVHGGRHLGLDVKRSCSQEHATKHVQSHL